MRDPARHKNRFISRKVRPGWMAERVQEQSPPGRVEVRFSPAAMHGEDWRAARAAGGWPRGSSSSRHGAGPRLDFRRRQCKEKIGGPPGHASTRARARARARTRVHACTCARTRGCPRTGVWIRGRARAPARARVRVRGRARAEACTGAHAGARARGHARARAHMGTRARGVPGACSSCKSPRPVVLHMLSCVRARARAHARVGAPGQAHGFGA